LKQYSKLNVI